MQSAGPMVWVFAATAVIVLGLMPAAWLLRALVARAVGARPAYGAALWTMVFGAVLWAMFAVVALIVSSGSGFGSGWSFATIAAVLSWLALSLGVRMYLPDPQGAKLAWPRALWVSLAPVLLLWGEAALVPTVLRGLGIV